MDFYMPPGINGAETSKKIKQILHENSLNSYIIWLTAQSEGDFEFDKKLQEFDDFWEKPLQIEFLKKIL